MNRHYEPLARAVAESVCLDRLRDGAVLITGANGLIGSHMAAVLAYANAHHGLNAETVCLSRGPASPWLASIVDGPRMSFIQADLAPGCSRLLPERRWTHVVHAATYGQPRKFLDNALGTMELNSAVTNELLQLAEGCRASFLFMSTSELYGNPVAASLTMTEDRPATIAPLDTRAAYNAAKLYGETLCAVYNRTARVRARIARVSSVYGPGVRLDDDRVMNVFILRALQTGALKMMDSGQQRRRWLFVSDATRMLFHILLKSEQLIYNVSGSGMVSIAEVASAIASETGVQVAVAEAVATPAHMTGSLPLIDIDNGRILGETGITDLLPLREGVRATVAWLRDLLGNPGLNPTGTR